ncbi:Kazal-type serine protease inhibitor domain-containing protein [Aeromonas sp. sif2433]|nr:hypothetical protein [Aeromonas sp. sif2433]
MSSNRHRYQPVCANNGLQHAGRCAMRRTASAGQGAQ